MIKVPIDIKRHVRKQVLSRIFSCGILLLASAVVVYSAKDYLKTFGIHNPLFAMLFLVIIICWATGVPLKLIDHSYEGTIANIRMERKMWTENGNTAPRLIKTFVYLEILTSKNLTETHIVNNSKLDEHGLDELYQKGDGVFHVYGTKYLGVFPAQNNYSICVVCGAKNYKIDGKCDICGYSLITKKHIKP